MESVPSVTGAATEGLKTALSIDTEKVRSHVEEVVRSTVEQALNQMLDEEADRVAGAGRYERSAERADTRAGSYSRKLQTKAGEVTLKVPRLRKLPLETAIIERYKWRESSVEEALIEMYLAGVSMRRVEDITEALWGTRVSASAVSDMAQKVYGQIEAWRNRRLAKVLGMLPGGAYLIGTGPGTLGITPISVDRVVLGRAATPLERPSDTLVDVLASDASYLGPHEVSRAHAAVLREGPAKQTRCYSVVDLGSTCGTFLNGVRLGAGGVAAPLESGDVLSLGGSHSATYLFLIKHI